MEFWKSAVALAGIGGVCAFVVWSVYRGVLRLPIFSQLTKKQTFMLLIVIVVLTFAFGVAGLVSYALDRQRAQLEAAYGWSRQELIAVLELREKGIREFAMQFSEPAAATVDDAWGFALFTRSPSETARLRIVKYCDDLCDLNQERIAAIRSGKLVVAQELTTQLHRVKRAFEKDMDTVSRQADAITTPKAAPMESGNTVPVVLSIAPLYDQQLATILADLQAMRDAWHASSLIGINENTLFSDTVQYRILTRPEMPF